MARNTLGMDWQTTLEASATLAREAARTYSAIRDTPPNMHANLRRQSGRQYRAALALAELHCGTFLMTIKTEKRTMANFFRIDCSR